MGKKYIINSAGNIVAQRDIYSLGGFIPKGTIGAAIANESVLSQDGESWITTSDKVVPATIRVKDNAFIWQIVSESVYTQTEHVYSGDTYIACNLSPQNISETFLPRQSMYVHNTYIASEITALFGGGAADFPIEQGTYSFETGKGANFEDLKVADATTIRTTASVVVGEGTQLYVPAGFVARLLWGWQGNYGNFAYYAGSNDYLSAGLHDLTKSVYKLVRVIVSRANAAAVTPDDVYAAGFRIVRAVKRAAQNAIIPASENSRSALLKDCRIYKTAASYAASYWNSIYVAGSAKNCNIEFTTPGAAVGISIKGRYRNIGYMRITSTQDTQIYTNAGRDTQIVAENCPYLAIENGTVQPSAIAAGGVTLRNCVVPKGRFYDNPMNPGNVYENIDFSFASEHIGKTTTNAGYYLQSGHIQGAYLAMHVDGGGYHGLVSKPDSMSGTASVIIADPNNPAAAPVISGYSYIGNGVRLTGDIQLHSQPYINRWISANMWERGSIAGRLGASFEGLKQPEDIGYPRLRLKEPIKVRQGDVITCATGYWLYTIVFNSSGLSAASVGWQNSTTVPSGAVEVALILKKAATAADAGELILPSDVITAAVKYQSTPRTLRYITNEADRTSPDDTLLGPDVWENKTYDASLTGTNIKNSTVNAVQTIKTKSTVNAQYQGLSYTIASTNAVSGAQVDARGIITALLSGSSANTVGIYPRVGKSPAAAIVPNDITAARLVITYQPAARIVLPYGASTLTVRGNGIRLYDNAVMSVGVDNPDTKIVLRGNSVMGELPAAGSQCSCTEGDEEAVIVKP